MHIVIAGNIGSGKTTMTNMLAKHYGWTPLFEPVEENPYLADYYSDIRRWAFNVEVYFLKQRFAQLLEIRHTSGTVIQDRSIFEGVHVFAAGNRDMGHMSARDYATYMELFASMMSVASLPHLLIYLRSSVPALVARIQKRGREFERSFPIDYLTRMNQRYEDFVCNKYQGKKLIINVDKLDFEHRPADFSRVVDKIDAQLFGLFD